MAKPPGIPYALIEKLRGEAPTVVAGFLNVVIFWIDQGKLEPLEESRIERLSLLPRNIWLLHGKLVVERLNEFTGPFIEHWKICNHRSGIYSQNAINARKALKLKNELKKRAISSIGPQEIFDKSEALSSLPHKLERTTRHNAEPPAYIINRSTQKPVPLKTNMKDV